MSIGGRALPSSLISIEMGKGKGKGKGDGSNKHIWGKSFIEPIFWDTAGPKLKHGSGHMGNTTDLHTSIAAATNKEVQDWGAAVRKEAAREDLTTSQREQVQLQLEEL